jgi:type VI secretion system protein ImpJ
MKGVLLSPQHLQTNDRFLEDLIRFQLEVLTPYPWGLHRLEINREALAGGSFALSAAAGIFPDGLLFDMPRSDATPQARQLEECWEPDTDVLDLYLAIPEYQYDAPNVSGLGRDANPGATDTRYHALVVPRRDETVGGPARSIQVVGRSFRLLAGREARRGNSFLPVARVQRRPTGSYQLDPDFVPPLLDISASEYVLATARRLVEILTTRSRDLSGKRRQRNRSLADFGISDVANFWLLYAVNSHFPVLRHLADPRSGDLGDGEVRRTHPVVLYSAMLSLAGALTTFSTAVDPRDLPTYNHSDLSGCFKKLDAMLRELLDTAVPVNYVSLPLQLRRPSIYVTALDQDRYLTAPQLYLAVNADGRPPDFAESFASTVKVSSADDVEQLYRDALGGVSVEHVPAPPSEIPIKVNYVYFLLGRSGPAWNAIARTRHVAVYVPREIHDPQMELVVILPLER